MAAILLGKKKKCEIQWFKSILGVTARELDLDQQLCWFISLTGFLHANTVNERDFVQNAFNDCIYRLSVFFIVNKKEKVL